MFRIELQLFAKKKGQGSVKNGRDSNPNYLGVKKYDGEKVAGIFRYSIIPAAPCCSIILIPAHKISLPCSPYSA